MMPKTAGSRASIRARPTLAEIPIDEVLTEGNIRTFRMDDEHGRGLRDSVKEMGVLQPILVAPLPRQRASGERYLLVAGFRRFAAACEAGLTTVPARIAPLTDSEVLLARLTENIQRLGATPLEEAYAIAGYRRLTGCSQEEVAHRLGKSNAWVCLRLQVLELPSDVRELIEKRLLTLNQVAQLLALPASDVDGIRELAAQARAGMPAIGLKDLAKSRLYQLAGGKGKAPSAKSCCDSCRCCRARRGS